MTKLAVQKYWRSVWLAREKYRERKYLKYKKANRPDLRKKWWRLWQEAREKRQERDRAIRKLRPTKTSSAGINLIAGFEGFRATAYKPVPGERYWTIGYGHYGPDVRPGQRITQQQARKLLAKDIERFEKAVERLVTVPLSQNEYDALVSFTYNVGEGALAQSTLLRKLNKGDRKGAAREFGKWVNGANGPLPGLVTRRAAERRLFER